MNRIVDKLGREIKAGDHVLIATSCTGTGYLRVAKIKEIGPKEYYGRTRDYVKLRTICSSYYDGDVTRGWVDVPVMNFKWNVNTEQTENVEGDIYVTRVIKIDDLTQFLTEAEIEGAKKLGLI